MRITKLGHCCLVLEVNGIKIVTDPGNFSTRQDTLTGVQAVVITHEHGDHFHVPSVAAIVKNNPGVEIVCNNAVAALVAKENILCKVNVVTDGRSMILQGVLFEAFGTEHAIIYADRGKCENTAYMIASKFYIPGDNFHQPGKTVDILALPVAGPWMKIAEAIEFAKAIKARVAFGVHDGILTPGFRPFAGKTIQPFMPETEYVTLEDGTTREF